jgi:hypothetical protein
VKRRLPLKLAAMVAGFAGATGAFGKAGLEHQVKAAFLGKFGAFVTWPQGAFTDPAAPLALCIVGHDPFGSTLDHGVRGETVEGRPIVVRRLGTLGAASGCHIAYLGGSPTQSAAAAARAGARAGVLTVSDGPVEGAAVQFVIRANRVRFRIDQRAAAAAGLNVSSKLLNLAVEVVR